MSSSKRVPTIISVTDFTRLTVVKTVVMSVTRTNRSAPLSFAVIRAVIHAVDLPRTATIITTDSFPLVTGTGSRCFPAENRSVEQQTAEFTAVMTQYNYYDDTGGNKVLSCALHKIVYISIPVNVIMMKKSSHDTRHICLTSIVVKETLCCCDS